mmetsp:Transcript_39110/g.63189  ORF Transcript_39110/g.63189 Transcript_39110/m.63189 type:complete len:481 (-) Transcript_39110:3445-4887(-)
MVWQLTHKPLCSSTSPLMETLDLVDEVSESIQQSQATTPLVQSEELQCHDATRGCLIEIDKRLRCVDVFRGLAVTGMILVDDVGEGYPMLNHSPWEGCTFADLVMPWFLLVMGTSMWISECRTRRLLSKSQRSLKHLTRAAKLYAFGLIMQGGEFFDGANPLQDNYSYGYNLRTLRFCGILNRIGFVYLVNATMLAWCPRVRSPLSRFTIHWILTAFIATLHLVLTYSVFVPSWYSQYAGGVLIPCETHGLVSTPECSVQGMLDRALFGQDHLGVWFSKGLPQCSTCPPSYCPNPSAPAWCKSHIYDPEGFLSSIACVPTTWLGIQFGILLYPQKKMKTCFALATCILFVGVFLDRALSIPYNKQLWSLSYSTFAAGLGGFVLCTLQFCLKVPGMKRMLTPLNAMGKNAFLMYMLHGPLEALLDVIYWQGDEETSRKQNLLGWILTHVFQGSHLWFALFKIGGFISIAQILAIKKYVYKI